MRLTRTSFLRLPRMSLRTMMIYVAVIAVAPKVIIELLPTIEMASKHWAICSREAAHDRELASGYRDLATRYPRGAVIAPDVFYVGEGERGIPFNGEAAARMAQYHDARLRIYDHAKWRPWSDMPDPFWPKSKVHFYKQASRGSALFFEPTTTMIRAWLSIERESSKTNR